MWPMLSLDPAGYYSVCFDDLVIDWVQQNIEALKSNGKQLVSSLMTDCVWLFVWEPGDTESAGTNILLNKLFRAENSKFSVRNCQVFKPYSTTIFCSNQPFFYPWSFVAKYISASATCFWGGKEWSAPDSSDSRVRLCHSVISASSQDRIRRPLCPL